MTADRYQGRLSTKELVRGAQCFVAKDNPVIHGNVYGESLICSVDGLTFVELLLITLRSAIIRLRLCCAYTLLWGRG